MKQSGATLSWDFFAPVIEKKKADQLTDFDAFKAGFKAGDMPSECPNLFRYVEVWVPLQLFLWDDKVWYAITLRRDTCPHIAVRLFVGCLYPPSFLVSSFTPPPPTTSPPLSFSLKDSDIWRWSMAHSKEFTVLFKERSALLSMASVNSVLTQRTNQCSCCRWPPQLSPFVTTIATIAFRHNYRLS